MSNNTSIFTLEDSCPDKKENNKSLGHNSIILGFIKDETPTYPNIDVNNQSYNIEYSNVIIKPNITPERFDIGAVEVSEIETKKDNRNTLIQNSISFVEDLVKEEIDIKEEVSTYLNNDTENVTVNNKKSNNITIGTLNVCMNIKIENDDNDTSCYNENLFNKIEQMSPKCSDIFTENIFEIKTENYSKNTDVQSSILIEDNLVKEEIVIEEEIPQHLVSHERELENHINTGENSNKCNICLKSHTSKKPYKCNICLKPFTVIKSLKRHMLSHSSKKPYKCNTCLKSFTRMDHFKNHMLSHTGEKPHKCNICFKSFTLKSVLRTHMSTHSNEKPHECNICLKSFAEKGTLKRHMLTHSSKNLHKCSICLKLYKRKDNLKIHMLTHTAGKK